VIEKIQVMQSSGRTILLVEQNARTGLSLANNGVVLESGRVRLKEITEDGREVLIRLIYPGEVFGAVIADALYRATAQADRPVRAHAWTAKAFTELLDRFPRLQKNLFALTKRFMALSGNSCSGPIDWDSEEWVVPVHSGFAY